RREGVYSSERSPMIIQATSAETRLIRLGFPNGLFNLKPQLVPRIIDSGSTELVTDRDIVLQRTEGATAVTDMILVPEFISPLDTGDWEIAYQSENENVATVDEEG